MRLWGIFVLSMGVMATSAYSSETAKRYDVRSAVVEYETTGSRTGTEKLYFTDYGRSEARYSEAEMSVMGFSSQDKTVDIFKDGWAYHIDLKTNTGTKTRYEDMIKQMGHDSKKQTFQDFSESMLTAMGAEKSGQDKVLGKTCQVYSAAMGYSVCVWKGIPLRYEVSIMGINFASQAVKIQTDVTVDSKHFEIPQSAKIREEQVPSTVVTAEDMTQFQDVQKQNAEMMQVQQELYQSPEYQDMMKQMQELQAMAADPESQQQMMETLQKMSEISQEMQNSPEYQQMLKQAETYENNQAQPAFDAQPRSEKSLAEEMTDTVESEAKKELKSGVKAGVGKAVGGLFKSLF
jgi:hypothetical protein